VEVIDVVAGLLGVTAVAAGLLVVTTRHLVHAALWLVVCLAAVGGMYLMLLAETLAWVVVLIYLGAVAVLLVFGVMLTRAPTAPSDDLDVTPGRRVVAIVAAGATAGSLLLALLAPVSGVRSGTEPGRGSPEAVGTALFGDYVLPFELLSVLLLAALVGAIVVSRSPAKRVPPDAGTAPR
jgi:NADH-quinone oxidoreductase subunit J